eukprot:365619-Chlamydomonas_euryale.AAC.20
MPSRRRKAAGCTHVNVCMRGRIDTRVRTSMCGRPCADVHVWMSTGGHPYVYMQAHGAENGVDEPSVTGRARRHRPPFVTASTPYAQ